jgi:hypothetical protein
VDPLADPLVDPNAPTTVDPGVAGPPLDPALVDNTDPAPPATDPVLTGDEPIANFDPSMI